MENSYFGKTFIYDKVLKEFIKGIQPGGDSDEKEVSAGRGYLYFYFSTGGGRYRTVESITILENEEKTF